MMVQFYPSICHGIVGAVIASVIMISTCGVTAVTLILTCMIHPVMLISTYMIHPVKLSVVVDCTRCHVHTILD